MISICIPIYNFNVGELVKKLSAQSKDLDIPAEIILIDDGSKDKYQRINETICAEQKYIKLEKNIGRAAIRNLFLKYAQFEYLLFLDCDSIISSDDFLKKYMDALKKYPAQLICGGRECQKLRPDKSKLLRWKYGVNVESKTFEERGKHPNKSFMSNNFLVSRAVFKTIQFNEKLVEYGHEDTLFGFELKKRNIRILHIDNPILNGDLDHNETYIKHTEEAISNLIHILKITEYDKELIQDVSLLNMYYKLYKVRNLTKVLFILLKPIIKYLLSHGYINLYVFDFYKLGTLTLKMNSIQE